MPDPVADPSRSFIETLRAHASVLGLMVSRSDHVEGTPRVKLEFWPDAPLWLIVELDVDAGVAMFYGVIRTYGLTGDRSDYHEVISALWAVGLRTAGFASVRCVHWNWVLFPAMVLRRLAAKGGGSDVKPFAAPVEAACRAVMAFETRILRAGVAPPFGGSILAVAERDA